MTTVDEQLEEARLSLLDMSLRNKLLNFREYTRSTARIVDEVPGQVFEQLVLEENEMSFVPKEAHPANQELDPIDREEAVDVRDDGTHVCLLCEGDGAHAEFVSPEGFVDHLESDHGRRTDLGEEDRHTVEEIEELWELPALEDVDDRHADRDLQTPHTEADLQKRLYNISNRAEALIEDAGYNALHLALGFLEWTEPDQADDEDPNRAPLVLVPVTLDRDGAQSAFTARWNQEEVSGNLSLELKLGEQGFELPPFSQPSEPAGIRAYLETVEDAVADIDGWQVVPDIHLGFFDFTKFIMYQDLDPDAWAEGHTPADHPLIRALLDPDATTDEPAPFDPAEIDAELAPEDVHHVKDADPSQIAAVEDVKRGRNLVIEGPPGTGKSQTIVNMIAELVADDKSVLFVSEKLAALDVVKHRLDTVGIGDFCLELHSDKASKAEFLDELERIAKLDTYDPDIPSETFDKLVQKQRELNAYAEALRTPVGDLERTPYDLYGEREAAGAHFRADDRELPRVEIDAPAEITPSDHQAAMSALAELRSRLETVAPVSDHPWAGCRPGAVLPDDRRRIEDHLEDTIDAVRELLEVTERLENECAVQPAESLAAIGDAIDAARVLRDSDPVAADVLRNPAWNSVPSTAEELIARLERYAELQADVGRRTRPDHVPRDIAALLSDYRRLHDSVLRYVRPSWYSVTNEIRALYGDDPPPSAEAIISDLEALIELRRTEEEIETADARGRELFGSLWQGTNSDPATLRQFSTWVVDFRQHLLDGVYGEESIELVTQGVSEDALSALISTADAAYTAAQEHVTEYVDMVGLNVPTVFDADVGTASLPTMLARFEAQLEAIERLERWSRFDQTREAVLDTPAAPVIELVETDELAAADVEPCYRANLADALLSVAFQEREALTAFDGAVHEDRIEQFRDLDERSLQIHRKRVFGKLVEGTPQLMEGASKSSPAGTLFHEFGKERRHKPIRVLLREAGELIQQMKPCFMMSPRSVAKYLEPDGIEFDVVIFDEASQVKPEDALGTILRGQQVVLLGDTNQLPPTSFFDQVVEQRDADDEWGFHVQDVESILDLCRSVFPSKRLQWHYRSRHESLIAVSNQEFYDNDLRIYPSPIQDSDELGLRLEHLPDTVYDRGGSSVNRQEAKAVAQAAVEHYRTNPSKSLGIGTFSQAQQEAVREEIELLRKENAEVDQYFADGGEEPFFVKNLERIQGDERDVIFISVGYGYDADGNFSHNFGPLNNRGGWRRLNVLITRARERCVVYANFTADALDDARITNRGLRSLKTFLEYAETRNLESLTGAGSDPDSPFERSVIEFLEGEGYEVHPRVGCAGFRIDLAIPDPDDPGRYVLGIECDGDSYHGTPVARARDRQRQAVLEDRGWTIQRVWSTDWYREKDRTKHQLLDAVEDAIERPATDPEETTPDDPAVDGEEPDGEASPDVDENPSIEDLQSDGAGLALTDIGTDYQPTTDVPYSRLGDHDVQSTTQAVEHIVNDEGPIHQVLLAKRLVANSDVSQRGSRVKETIDAAIGRADVDRKGEFLYPREFSEYAVRRRDGPAADIEWIPDGEIAAAVVEILEKQYETPREDLIKQTGKVLGFERTGTRMADRIGGVIDGMHEDGRLVDAGGRLALPDA